MERAEINKKIEASPLARGISEFSDEQLLSFLQYVKVQISHLEEIEQNSINA